MRLPNFFYRSERVGKNGKRFSLLKVRTLTEGFRGRYATEDGYTRYGKLLRRLKLDELPQILSVLRRSMNIVGPRPMTPEEASLLPRDTRQVILSRRPGLTSLASVAFFNEERLLKGAGAPEIYYTQIKPLKIALDAFYVNNKCFLLDLAILWMTAKLVLRSIFTRG